MLQQTTVYPALKEKLRIAKEELAAANAAAQASKDTNGDTNSDKGWLEDYGLNLSICEETVDLLHVAVGYFDADNSGKAEKLTDVTSKF